MRAALALVVALLATGCARPDWMGPPPPEGTPVGFADGFQTDSLASGLWTLGHWKTLPAVHGQAGVQDGWLDLAMDRDGEAWSAGHPFRADAREVFAQTRVRADGPIAGLTLASNDSWVSLIGYDEGFCLCGKALGHSRVVPFGPLPEPGDAYTLRLRLDWRGEAEAWVFDDAGREVGHLVDANFDLRAAQVTGVWLSLEHLVNADTRPSGQFDYALAWSGNLPADQLAALREAATGDSRAP